MFTRAVLVFFVGNGCQALSLLSMVTPDKLNLDAAALQPPQSSLSEAQQQESAQLVAHKEKLERKLKQAYDENMEIQHSNDAVPADEPAPTPMKEVPVPAPADEPALAPADKTAAAPAEKAPAPADEPAPAPADETATAPAEHAPSPADETAPAPDPVPADETATATSLNAEPKHILFLMADQMDGRILDESSVQYQPPMRNLRKLASSGVNFVNAYTNAPLCVPSRTSMFTGRHSSQIQVFNNGFGLAQSRGPSGVRAELDHGCNEKEPENCMTLAQKQDHDGTFVDALSRVGYDIHLYGKMHVGANLVHRYAKRWDVSDGTPFGGWNKNPDWLNIAEEWTQESGIMSHLRPDPGFGKDFAKLFISGTDPRSGVAQDKSSTPGDEMDYHTAQECSMKLDQGLFTVNTPQFLYCSFVAPHQTSSGLWLSNSTYLNRIKLSGDHAVPPLQAKETMHPADWYVVNSKGGVGIGENNPHDIARARQFYFSDCEMLDDLVGEILAALDRGGGRDHTYIVFVSDHGEHAFENYQYEKDSFKEASARVPFIIAGPGIPATGPTTAVASLHDVFPTLLAMAGVAEPQERLVGESLLSIATGAKTIRNKPYVVGEYHSRHVGTGTFMVVAHNYKLIEYGEHQLGGDQWPPQLFDLEADPREFNNLAQQMPDKVAEMGRLLRQEIDIGAVDKAKKAQNKDLFKRFIYDKKGGAQNCIDFMQEVFVAFDDSDAQKLSNWSGESCNGSGKLTEGSDVGRAGTLSRKEAKHKKEASQDENDVLIKLMSHLG